MAASRMNFAERIGCVHREGGIPPSGGHGNGNGGGKPFQPKPYSLSTAARSSTYHFNRSRAASSDHYFFAHDAPLTTYRSVYIGGSHGSAQKQDDPAANDELQTCIKRVLSDQMLLSTDFKQSRSPKILSLRHKFDQATPEQKLVFQNVDDQLTGQIWTAYKACNYK